MKTGMIWSVFMAVLLMPVAHRAAAFGEDPVYGTVERISPSMVRPWQSHFPYQVTSGTDSRPQEASKECL